MTTNKVLTFSDAMKKAKVVSKGLRCPAATKGIYYYKGEKGIAVRTGSNDQFSVVTLDSPTAEYLTSYGVRGTFELTLGE
jgi:hypothetical protein